MKIKLLFLDCVWLISLLNAQDSVSTRSVSVEEVVKAQSVVDIKNKEYIDAKEFGNILREAEDKLKMEKDKNKRLRDYVFELMNIKRKMYPHERVKAGLALEEMKEKYPDMAIKIFSKEIEMSGGNKDAYFERGELYTRMCYSRNDKSICEKAVADLREAIKNSKSDRDLDIWGIPFRMQAYDRLGYIYKNTIIKDLNLSLFYYTKAIESDITKPSSEHFERGNVYIMMGKYDEAINDLINYKKSTTNTGTYKTDKIYSLCYNLYEKSNKEFIPECPTREEIEKRLNVKFKGEEK